MAAALSVSVLTLTFLTVADISYVRGQCSGTPLVFTATSAYQVFTSTNYPFNYGNNMNCIWRIQATNATDAIRLEVTDTSIEYHADCVYDSGEAFDGYNVTSVSLGKFCGTSTPNYVSSGNYMTVVFISDYSMSARGFKAQYKSGERSSLLDPEDSSSNFDAVAILGASIGAVVLIVIIMAVIFTYIQAKKAKEIRRNPHLRRGMSTSRVEPFSYDYGPTDYWGPPPPPPYGDIYSTPVSPPPMYSEVDPNPQQDLQLPGRPMNEACAGNVTARVNGENRHISAISNNPANTRFSQPPTSVAPIQTSGAFLNPAFVTVQQQNIHQNNISGRATVSNRASVSNAGAVAAMRLLGANTNEPPSTSGQGRGGLDTTTRPVERPGRSLPNVRATSPTPRRTGPQTNPVAAGTTTAVVTNTPRTSVGVTSPRNMAPATTESLAVGRAANRAPAIARPSGTELQRTASDVSDLSLGRSISVCSGRSSLSSVSSRSSITPIANA